jgi:Tfp pilus assembly protein PilF
VNQANRDVAVVGVGIRGHAEQRARVVGASVAARGVCKDETYPALSAVATFSALVAATTAAAGVGSALGWKNLGVVNDKRGRLDDAVADEERSVAIDGQLYEPHLELASIYMTQGKRVGAFQENEEAARLNPAGFGAHENLALLYQRGGEPDRAIAELETAVRLDPEHGPHKSLGYLLYQRGQFARAAVEFQAALRRDGGDVDVFNDLGVADTR